MGPYRLLYRHTIGPTALTRRALFDDIGGWDVELAREIVMGYEDWEFWLDALARGWHGIKVPEVTHLYRRHGTTMLSGARREYRRWYRALSGSSRRPLPAAAGAGTPDRPGAARTRAVSLLLGAAADPADRRASATQPAMGSPAVVSAKGLPGAR